MRPTWPEDLVSADATSISEARALLVGAEHILVATGSGMSAAAGYDYGDEAYFARVHPELHAMGARNCLQFITTELPQQVLWTFWRNYVWDIRLHPHPHPKPLDSRLREMIADRDYAVLTSNVDELLARNGFSVDAYAKPQGDYAFYQCTKPCVRRVWDVAPVVERLRDDAATHPGLSRPEVLPTCPNCGGPTFLNVRADSSFIDEHLRPGIAEANNWLSALPQDGQGVVVLEIGAGFNTPSVVRWPVEHIVRSPPESQLVRVNIAHPGVPQDLAGRSASVSDAETLLEGAAG